MKNLRRTPESEPVSHPGMFEVYKIRNSVCSSRLHIPDGPSVNSDPENDAVKPVAERSPEMIAYFLRAGY